MDGELDHDHALDALYAASPAAFTAQRDALAKELKAADNAAGGSHVKSLRKPTQVAHVLGVR